MASKDPSKLYSLLDSMRTDMEGLLQKAQELSNEVANYGGVLNAVLKEQLIKYYAPTIKNLIDGEETPGSIVAMVRFLDSLPLGSIRQQPSLDDTVAPIAPETKELDMPAGSSANPVDNIPQNASYANGTEATEAEAPVEESLNHSEQKINESIEKYQVVRLMNNNAALPKDMVDFKDEIIDEFETKEEAEERAEVLNNSLLPEETEVFGTKYEVKKVEIEVPESDKVDEKDIEKEMPKAKKLPK